MDALGQREAPESDVDTQNVVRIELASQLDQNRPVQDKAKGGVQHSRW